jgi:DNA-binding response OmpR family regulator
MGAANAANLLVVDSDQTFTRTLCRLLTENGYDAASLSSAIALEEYLATRPVDLVMVDLSLPGPSGGSALESLRRNPAYADLPILAVTGSSPEDTSVEALRLGASDVITKPVRVRELLARSDRGRSLGLAGRSRVLSQFDWRAAGARLSSLYLRLLAQ